MEVKQEINESQTDDDDIVQIRESNNENNMNEPELNGSPKSRKMFIQQQERIKELESQVDQL